MPLDKIIDSILSQIVGIGGRAVGSEGEARSAEVMERVFRDAGLEVSRQKFTMSRWPLIVTSAVVPFVAALVIILAAVLYPVSPLSGAALLACLLSLLVVVRSWHHCGEGLFDMGRQIPAFNVIGRSTASAENADVKTIVFTAHYDSKSQTMPVALRLGALLFAVILCAVLLVLFVLAAVGLFVTNAVVVNVICCVAFACLLFQVFNTTGNDSVGALDNASGVAVLAGLAQTLPAVLSDKVNLIFIATGAEELGLGGALRFVQEHGSQLDRKNTFCVNFDTLGGGGKVYLIGLDSGVTAKLLSCLQSRSFRTRRLPILIGVGMDHMRFEAAGLTAVSLTQGPLMTAVKIHSRNDTIECIDVQQLTKIAEAVTEFAQTVGHNDVK